jgi:hypothetical protein
MKTDGIFPVPPRSIFYIFPSVSVFARSRFRICHYRRLRVCRAPETLGKGRIVLGKGFAERNARQRAPGNEMLGKGSFAERLLSGARQSLFRAPRRPSAKKSGGHGVTFSLPSASSKALDKEQINFF